MTTKPTLLLLGLLLVAVGVAAQPTVTAAGGFLSIGGVETDNGAIFTVIGPGGHGLMQNIAPGQNVTLDLLKLLRHYDAEAVSLTPGVYHYELVSRPGGRSVTGRFRIGASSPDTGDGGQAESSIPQGDKPPPVPNASESDFLQIADSVDDGTTVLDLDSDDPGLDQHWGVVNDMGLLKLREHTTNITNTAGTTNVVFMRGDGAGGVGIGSEVSIFPLNIQSSQPLINMVDTDGGTNWKLINGDGDFLINGKCASSCSALERWNIVTIEDGALEDSIIIGADGFSASSSRTVKKNIEPVVASALLDELSELPIYTWSYATDAANTRHVGPMAEDFHHRFGVGPDEKRISSIDTGGVALAAIQALRQEVLEKDVRLEALERQLEVLQTVEQRLEQLERLIAESP